MKTVLSRSQDPILLYESRHLASSVDPKREGDKWAQRQTVLPHIHNIIVIGIGCGYHLSALENLYPQTEIFAVDFNSQSIDFISQHQTLSLTHTKLIGLTSADEIYSSSILSDAVSKPYALLIHEVSEIYSQNDFASAISILSGRSPKSFNWIVTCRNWSELIQNSKNGEVISIKNLKPNGNASIKEHDRQILALKTVRELIV